ncbi:MAG: murein biosynthesis integral membrane protein MurJ [bacterium]
MSNNSDESSGLGLSALVVSLGTLLSRIFGLIRDICIAYVFGASRITDVFFIAYQIPSLFRKLLAEGALSSAVVPVYVDIRDNESPRAAQELASAVFTWTILLVGGLVIVGTLAAPLLVGAIAPGLIGTGYFSLTVTLTRQMFPFLLMMSGAAVTMGILHARKTYAPSAFAPVCLNIALVLSLLFLAPVLGSDPRTKVGALVVGVLVGGFFQFFVQWLGLARTGLRLEWNPDWSLDGLYRILDMMGPMVLGLAVTQLIVLIDKLVASFLYAGNISYLYYSNRLFQFPFAMIGIALGTVVLPESSEQVSDENLEEVAATTRESLGMMSFLMVPSAVGLALIGHPLIGLLFRRRNFTAGDQAITFGVLLFALLGLLAYGFIRIFVSLCYSFEDTMGPLKAALVALGTNALLDPVFVLLWPGDPLYRVCGLTLAGSIAVWIQSRILRNRLSMHLPDFTLIPWDQFRRHLGVTTIMALVLIPVVRSPLSEFMRVFLGTTVGAGLYMTLAYLLGDPHPTQVVGELKKRFMSDDSTD